MIALLENIADQLTRDVQRGAALLIADVREEIEAQGHRASGRLWQSIEADIKADILDGSWTVNVMMEDYGAAVNDGVRASRVAYQRGSGRKSSKFISALLEWADIVKPGLSEKEKRGFVFAVANNAKKEGIPSAGSYSFSSNGRRTLFLEQSRYEDTFTSQINEEAIAESVVQFYVRRFAV